MHLGVDEAEVVPALWRRAPTATQRARRALRAAAEAPEGHEASRRAMLAAGVAHHLEATAKVARLGVALGGAQPARLWAAAAGAKHAPWLRAWLPALHRARQPAEAARCVLKLALALL